MKKITQSVMALSLVIPSAALIQTAEKVEAQTQKEVTSFSLNVRSGPGANHKIVDWLKKGQIVNVLNDGKDWDYIQFDNGKKGYVSDEYLKTIATGSETRSVTAYSLTMRTGPGANYQAIDWLTKGTNVKVLSTSGDWVRVNVDGKIGYLHSGHLSKGTVSSVTTPSTTISSSSLVDNRTVSASSLTVRTGPSTNYKAIDWLKKGMNVKVLSTSGDWIKINVNGKTGYVHKDYLTKSSVSTPAPSNNNVVREVTAYWLTMRTGAGSNYKVVDYLKKGTDVTVHSYKGEWAYVSAQGNKGYVHSSFLSKGNATTVPSPSKPVPPPSATKVTGETKYVNAPDGLNLRTGRGVQNKIVVKMPYTATVKVSNVVNGWGEIQYGNYSGYANVGYLVNSKPFISTPSTPVEPNGSLKGKLIVLDPGHGGPYAGAQGIVKEEKVNLQIALKTRDKLQQMGARVVMTRTSDSACSYAGYTQDLVCRPTLAKKVGADAFVSIHANSGTSSAYGSETFYYNSGRGDQKLARYIADEINEETGMRIRRVAYANFSVLRNSTVPATLVETGFVSNANDAAKLGSDQYQHKFAKAIAEGIENFF